MNIVIKRWDTIICVIANVVGLGLYASIARTTWNINFVATTFAIQGVILVLDLFLFIGLNAIWLLIIIFRFRSSPSWLSLALWVVIAGTWYGVDKYDAYRFGLERKKYEETAHRSAQ
jgi:hypothetical protein